MPALAAGPAEPVGQREHHNERQGQFGELGMQV